MTIFFIYLLVFLVPSPSLNYFPSPVDKTSGCPLDEIHGYLGLPHHVDLVHQLSSVLRHRVREHKLLRIKIIENYSFSRNFWCTFITPQIQKSRGARSGEFGAHSLPPHGRDPSARVLSPKLDLRRARTLTVRWHEAPSFNYTNILLPKLNKLK